MTEGGAEENLGGGYVVSEKQLRKWQKKWKRFHRPLPSKIDLGRFIFYRDQYGTYSPIKPEKIRKWYWPFWRI